MSDFPASPEDLSAQWLTGALQDAGCLDDGGVASFACERIGTGAGFLGQLVRITPVYQHVSPEAPRSLVAKFASALEPARAMAAMYGLYRCEVNFYRHVAGATSLRTPRCYFGAVADDGTTFLLLLEDLARSGEMGDQVSGCRLEQSRLAVRELATFHAAWLNSPRLDAMDWLPLGVDLGRISLEQAYPVSWPACVKSYGDMLPPRLVDAIPMLNERLLSIFPRFVEAPRTIMHGDYRLDNMFFGGPESGYKLAVIDWQIANRGWGLYDVAYFLSSNLETDERRVHEEPLLREYHRILTAEGGVDYGWERCREDYVLSTAIYFANMVGNIASLDPADERGAALFELILTRIGTAVEDLGALALLP